jgi:hypothetical protein
LQENLDGDVPGDACDADADGDGTLNGADCAWLDPTAREAPVEVAGLQVLGNAGEILVAWLPQPRLGSSGAFDVAAGTLRALRLDRGFASAICRADGATAPLPIGADAPPPSEWGSWYLVRATSACGAGPWGRTSLDAVPTVPCP